MQIPLIGTAERRRPTTVRRGGAPTTQRNVLTPALVAGITDAVDVTAGEHFSCARRRDGSTWC